MIKAIGNGRGKSMAGPTPDRDPEANTEHLTRRSFLRGLGGFLASHWLLSSVALGGGGLVAWAEHDTTTIKLEKWDLFYPGLPAALNGKTIVQLSDLHLESLQLPPAKIKQTLGGLQPDLLVFTGDLISTRSDLDKVQAYLDPWEARQGRYFVMGNNDYAHFSRTLFKRYLSLLRGMGWIPLLNQAEYLTELNLWVIGIDDPATAHDDVDKAYASMTAAGTKPDNITVPTPGTAGAPEPALAQAPNSPARQSQAFRLVLAHSTDCLDDVAAYGADLLLTGHTHGGQIRLPGFKPLVTNTYLGGQGIYEGYHIIDGVPLYINRGIGESVLPLRLNALPEITLFTLHLGNSPAQHG